MREVRTVVSLGGDGVEIGKIYVGNSRSVLFFELGAGYPGVLTL